ncbi:Dienelactone hydrolase family protein [hydrothermal vent metagenome]|uniref:Dienelactone hydrolase family protein n=1 Tax=hydrothermal vent metagenome TaxID=652676 RepID=A0A3B1AAL7_9ZZZZ
MHSCKIFKANVTWIVIASGLIFSPSLYAKVITKVIPYSINDVEMTGYYAYDDAIKGKRPGVLVVHEWWGHNDYARKRVRMLAKLGYSAFALDMYGTGKVAKHPDSAKKFMSEVLANMGSARLRYKKALAVLKAQPVTDAGRIAAIGYCFGGGVVLDMARQGLPLKGVVSFHGSIGTKTPAVKDKVKASVLVLNGADDPFVTKEQISALKQEMKNAGVQFEFINYKGVKHSFTNPASDAFGKKFNMPLQYSAEADKKSWAKMQAFFKQIFK